MAEESAIDKQYDLIVSQIEKDSNMIFTSFDSCETSNITVNNITKEFILNVRHLLLPLTVRKAALGILRNVNELKNNCMYGDTYLGDEIFGSVMVPEMRKCMTSIKKEDFRKAYNSLLGMFLVLWYEENWVRDNESWMDKAFPKFFKEFSLCWKIMLAQPDDVLQLDCKGGLDGGYRPTLISLLEEVQNNVNSILADIDDCFDTDQTNMHSRITMFPLPGVPLTIDDLPGRKKSTNPIKPKAKSKTVKKPATKKPRKPQRMWLPMNMSAAERKQIVAQCMENWKKDVKQWEIENNIQPTGSKRKQLKPLMTAKGPSKKKKPNSPKKAQPTKKANSPKKAQPTKKTIPPKKSSDIESVQHFQPTKPTVTRSGREAKPVTRYLS